MKKIKINWRLVFIVSVIIFAITWPLNYKNPDDLILRIIVAIGILIVGFEVNKAMKIMDRSEAKI